MTVVKQHKNPGTAEISLTAAAEQHILAYLGKQAGCKGVRFSVKATGCSGYGYVLDYVEEPKEGDIVQRLSDDYKIYIAKKSYPFLKGLSVDYIREGLNFKFKFNNPNQSGECGCGESFTVDAGKDSKDQ